MTIQVITNKTVYDVIQYNIQLISMPSWGGRFVLLFLIFLITSHGLQINLIGADNTTTNMYNNGEYNQMFIENFRPFNCSMNNIYTYSQTAQQYSANTPYSIRFSNYSQNFTFTLKSVYKNGIRPNTSISSCSKDGNNSCVVTIYNNCPTQLGQFNYFTILELQVESLPVAFNYFVLCNNSFSTNTFQWGLVILMVFCFMLLILTVIYSKAWSMGGFGIRVNYWLIIIFWIFIVIGGILAETTENVVEPIVEIVILLIGIAGIWVCSNETIFLFKFSILQRGIQIKDLFKIRILDMVSLFIGIGVVLGYYFSHKNWIFNNVICVCIIIAAIKVMKYTNLKISIFALFLGIAVQMAFVQYIHFAKNTSYNDLILNYYNFPFELQLPTINPVYKQKCAWLPFTAIINPGIFMSYLRRFDVSRNTNIYFLTSIIVFFIGSVVWMIISIGSVHSWPFEIVTGPTMMGLIVLFAYKRMEIRTLWEGIFYDEDFANRDGILEILDVINDQKSPQNTQNKEDIELIRSSVMDQIKLNKRDDSDISVLRKVSNFSNSYRIMDQQMKSKQSQKS